MLLWGSLSARIPWDTDCKQDKITNSPNLYLWHPCICFKKNSSWFSPIIGRDKGGVGGLTKKKTFSEGVG